MLKKFFTQKTWLKSAAGTDRLYILELSNVKDCFNAHDLWDAQYSGNNAIIESQTQKKEYRLQNALHIHRIEVPYTEKQGKRERLRKGKYVFNDVIVRIPKQLYDEDVRDDAKKIRVLTTNLTELHKQNFADNLWKKDRKPSYTVSFHNDKADDIVIFQFGSGVFVPNAHDKLIASIQVMTEQGNLIELPDWSFWQESREDLRKPALYMGQDSIIIGKTYNQGAICVPEFFSDSESKGFIHINCHQRIAYGDGNIISSQSNKSISNNQTIFELKNKDNDKKYKIVWTDNQTQPPGIFLSGYAFLTNKTIDSWLAWFDKFGMPCNDIDAVVHFWGTQNKLYAREKNKKTYNEIEFKDKTASFEIFTIFQAPEQLKNNYTSLLYLPIGLHKHLADIPANNQIVLGRSTQGYTPDLSIDFFSDPKTIKDSTSAALGHIGLSRKHAILTWQTSTGKLFIQQISSSSPVHIIKNFNQEDQIIETLAPASDIEKEITLNDKLIIGFFIFDFKSAAIDGTL